MKVFVTGGTGTLGRPVLRQLVQANHEVVALSRNERADERLRQLGGRPVRADLFDPASLELAMRGAEAVLHLATRIPGMNRIGRRSAWAETDRIRRDGTRNLVDVALNGEVRVFVYPSVAFLYPDSGATWIDAATPPAPPEYMRTTLDAEAEVARFAASGKAGARGVSLRMAGFYGPESAQTEDMLRLARLGIAPVMGRDAAYTPTIWIDDAASAVVAALERAPSGVYDIVDDEPLTRLEQRQVLARCLGRAGLWRIPDLLAPLALGVVTDALTRSQRLSNRRFKEAAGWAPQVKSAAEGWAKLLGAPRLSSLEARP